MKSSSIVAETFAKLQQKSRTAWQSLRDRPLILVGTATCGRAAGALEILKIIKEELEKHGLDAQVLEVGCMGHCYAEPLVTVYKPGFPPISYGYVTEGIAARLVQDFLGGDDPCLEFALAALETNDMVPALTDFPRGMIEKPIILDRCGLIDPAKIEHYIALGGYAALAGALTREPEWVLEEIKASGLRGRGGAGFPTGRKWETCRLAPGEKKYVICNADEGDPGAFMDRAILESNPHEVLEGLAIAAYAVGARQGYFYIRAEYPLAVERVKKAIEQARQAGLLGINILGSGFSFDVDVFQGSGAFVCGEETALIASMEGEPGLPRHRPPFPATAGLWGKPTVINNVKTLAYVPHIIERGAQWFRETGTAGSPGTAVFALAGKVINTGLAEVPMGTTLRELVYDVGSGIPRGKAFKAVQIGGPSGGCLPETALDMPIDFDSLSQAGAMMGSGGMVILDEDDCMVEIARFFLDFTQKESCGKCTMCHLGTKQMLEILEAITKGQGKPGDIELLLELAEDVKAGSLCGLGKTAPNPVLSTIRYFRDEYEAHIKERRCPALMCRELIAYYILPEKCERSCDACVGSCPVEAIYPNEDRIKVIDQQKCVKCASCLEACPPQYKAVIKLSPPELVAERGA
ncbi:NADH-quinone oxidoreductase subunit NuoF [Desulfofundulus thermosubterraneus]|uniref:NADH-quinone oxidoreductase subunit F n=1 Tax=Desulfofundulus thermosubterraneus DSM 16057 TaxID=1121432 RepID=A0A1M6G3T9_9FIRM|nr:NADH-quinone oxidoreductase subunit NuoF [Desulfofundulus thermosubterraneus]SHJ04636.1 NADH-quinone oxidoreductase subunit F [Desulfofundulus thermosubterraneus DSM 16057]